MTSRLRTRIPRRKGKGEGKVLRSLVPVVTLLATISLGGCVASRGTPGDQLLRKGEHQAAVAAFEAEERAQPDNPEPKRKLAIALLRLGDAERALQKLDQASQLAGENRTTLLFRAQAHEQLEDLDQAIWAYNRYLLAGGNPRGVRARLDALALQKAARHAQRAIAREDSLRGTVPDDKTLVVPDFTNAAGIDDLAPLERGLAAVLITDLSKIERLRVLERGYLNTLMTELDLARGATQAPDTGTIEFSPPVSMVQDNAPRLGRLLGAGTFVQGVFSPQGSSRIQMNSSVIDASSGNVAFSGELVEGELKEVLLLEKELVYQVLEHLGIEPTPREREKIDRLPTQSFQAFLDYSRGLYLRDLGLLKESQAAFEDAVDADADFDEAQAEADRGTEDDITDLVEAELEATITPATEPGDILGDVVGDVGGGPAPDEGGDESEVIDEPGPVDFTPTTEDRVNMIPEFPEPPPGRTP